MAVVKPKKQAHFEMGEEEYEREEKSEKLHEEDLLEFKKKQRRRSSVAKLPKALAGMRRASTGSADSYCEYNITIVI